MPIKFPNVTISIIPAQQLSGVKDQNVLFIGQKVAAGSAVSGELQVDIPDDGSEDALFGAISHLAGVIRAGKVENKVSAFDAIGLDDAAGVAAESIITLATGPATEDGSFYVNIVSKKTLRRKIDFLTGDTIDDIAAAIATAYADATKKPFTIANVAGVVTSTATNKGSLGNGYGLSIEGTIPGVTIALTGWTGGATDPSLSNILDVIGDKRYQTIMWPSAYDISEVEDLLNERFNSENAILDGIAVQTKVDTLANLKAYVAPLNSQSVSVIGIKVIAETSFDGPATLESPDIIAAQVCAIRALRLTQGAQITDYLTSVASADQFGGVEIASLPYANTLLPNLPVASQVHDFSGEDLAELTGSGLSAIGPNSAFNATIMGEFVTTYLTDPAANADDSFKYLNTMDASSVVREFFFANLKSRYAQTRLTDGDLIPRRDMANESSIRAFCNELYDVLANATLTQKSTAAKKDFNENLSIVVDVRNGTATFAAAPLLVSQMRAIFGTLQINFGG